MLVDNFAQCFEETSGGRIGSLHKKKDNSTKMRAILNFKCSGLLVIPLCFSMAECDNSVNLLGMYDQRLRPFAKGKIFQRHLWTFKSKLLNGFKTMTYWWPRM